MPSAALARTTLAAAAGSHAGLQRDNNEDRYHCDAQRGIFLVVDGVGGHAAGEKAADTALTLMRARLERETGSAADRVREAITLANNEIFRLAGTEPSWAGMACVLTVALVRDGRVTVGHVGDTRLYAFSAGAIRKVTHDHSPIGEREDQGDLDEMEAMRHPRRNEIYRDVGSQHHEPGDEEFIETLEFPFEPDTALLLCTDGLSDMVPSTRLAQIVSERASDPTVVVERLIEAANAAGGKDNVTAVFVAGPAFAQAARRATGVSANGRSSSTPGRTTAGGSFAGKLALLIYGLAIGLALAGALLFFSQAVTDRAIEALQPAGWNKTWYVGPGEYHDFATIQEALTRAQPGDVVEVDNGGYDLPIVLPAGVDLVARKPREAILRVPSGVGPASPGIQVGGQSRVSGFKVDATGVATAIAAGEGEMLLEDLEILGASKAAVVFGARSRGTLRASHLHDNAEAAVVVASEALPRLLHNVISGNGKQVAAGGRPGNGSAPRTPVPAVLLQQGASAAFFGNIIAGNGDDQVAGLPPEKRADLVRDNMIGPPPQPRPAAPAGRGGRAAPPRQPLQ